MCEIVGFQVIQGLFVAAQMKISMGEWLRYKL
jgi:hypothetical protein